MSSSVAVGTWVKAYDGAGVKYLVSASDESVEFEFAGEPAFELILTEEVLARCADLFPEALRGLRAVLTDRNDE